MNTRFSFNPRALMLAAALFTISVASSSALAQSTAIPRPTVVGGGVNRQQRQGIPPHSQPTGIGRTNTPTLPGTSAANNINVKASEAIRLGDQARESSPPDFMAAMTWYEMALMTDAGEARAYLGMGQVFGATEQYEAAASAYQQAITLKPKMVEAHVGLGNALLKQERYDEAMESFQKAISLKPKTAGAHLGLADCHFIKRQYTQAAESYRKAVQFDSKSLPANYRLGITYLLLDNREAAITQHNILKSLDKDIAAKFEAMLNLQPAANK
jgi:Tfp pilus assembly protein PilF